MGGARVADILFYGVMLILPLSALIVRRERPAKMAKMALAWIAIFGVGLVLVSQRDRLSGLGPLLSDQRIEGGTTRIRMAQDGHFWADVTINGVRRRMLVDSGATTTALSVDSARAAKLDLAASPFATMLETANGPVAARSSSAARVLIGNVVASELGVVVSPAFGDTDVIGMNFLSRLASWRVENQTLVLQAR